MLAKPADWFPEMPLGPYEADVLLDGGETLELAGIAFETLQRPRPLARPRRLLRGRVRSSRATSSSPGSVGRTDLPHGDWDTLLESIRELIERFPPETVVYSGHGPETTLGDELARNPFLARAPRLVKFEAPRGTHDVLPRSSRSGRRSIRDGRGALRAPTATAGSRRRSSRTRGSSRARPAQGSDIVQKEMYTFDGPRRPLAHAAAGGHGADRRAYVAARPAPRAAAGEDLHDRARCTATPRRSAGKFREHWQLNVEAMGSDDPAIDAEIIQLYAELLRRLGDRRLVARAELDRRPQLPSRSTSSS